MNWRSTWFSKREMSLDSLHCSLLIHHPRWAGYNTVEKFTASIHFICDRSLAVFIKEYPKVSVVLVNRNGEIIGESP
jgi:hypothetical protein